MTESLASANFSLRAKAVLFDMDGTLVDSGAIVEAMWAEFAAEVGADARDVIDFAHGRPSRDTIARYAPLDVDRWTEWMIEGEHTRFNAVVEIPGATTFVNSLPRDRWALVTSALHVPAAARLRAIGIEPSDVLVAADDVTVGKPDPEGYLAAASALGLAPQDCVVFEDTDAGVRAGLAAGCAIVVVGNMTSEATAGLARIRNYAGASVRLDGGDMTLNLNAAKLPA